MCGMVIWLILEKNNKYISTDISSIWFLWRRLRLFKKGDLTFVKRTEKGGLWHKLAEKPREGHVETWWRTQGSIAVVLWPYHVLWVGEFLSQVPFTHCLSLAREVAKAPSAWRCTFLYAFSSCNWAAPYKIVFTFVLFFLFAKKLLLKG